MRWLISASTPVVAGAAAKLGGGRGASLMIDGDAQAQSKPIGTSARQAFQRGRRREQTCGLADLITAVAEASLKLTADTRAPLTISGAARGSERLLKLERNKHVYYYY